MTKSKVHRRSPVSRQHPRSHRRSGPPYFRLLSALLAAIILAAQGSGRPNLQAQALPCNETANPVACENLKPGDLGWDIIGAGDPSIQGFATNISVNIGQ